MLSLVRDTTEPTEAGAGCASAVVGNSPVWAHSIRSLEYCDSLPGDGVAPRTDPNAGFHTGPSTSAAR